MPIPRVRQDSIKQDVDGVDKPGHDGIERLAFGI
jgi:hypothetical protein